MQDSSSVTSERHDGRSSLAIKQQRCQAFLDANEGTVAHSVTNMDCSDIIPEKPSVAETGQG